MYFTCFCIVDICNTLLLIYFVAWRIAAQVMFAIGYLILIISLLVAIGNLIFGCCKQKIFAKESCPIIFGILIAVASKLQNEIAVYRLQYVQQMGVS